MSSESYQGTGESILYVEDSPSQAEMCKDLLEENGYKVRICETGEDGLESLKEERPALVLLDLQLPGMDGFHVCEAIRDDPDTYDLPVIILTSRTEVPAVIEGLSVGADDYVSKAEDSRTLLARIKRLLDRARHFKKLSAMERLGLLKKASETLSHGIKNPMQVVFLSLEMLAANAPDDPSFEEARSYLNQYLGQVVRLVKNIEKVSKIAESTFIERDRLVDIEHALEQAGELAREIESFADGSNGES